MHRLVNRVTTLALSCAATAWIGCVGAPAGGGQAVYDGPVNSCSAGQCRGLSQCDTELGLCALDGPHTSRDFFLEISLPEEDVAPRRHKESISPSLADASLTISVSPAVTVRSNVKINSCDARVGVLARLIFTRKTAAIPGLAPPMDVVRATGATKSFEVDLAPGVYDIHIRPLGEYRGQVPPTELSSIAVMSDGTLVDKDDHELACLMVSSQGQRISGRITRAGVAANGLTVEAIDKENHPSRSASTTSVTQCLDDSGLSDRCGRFEVITNHPVEDLALRIFRPEDPRYPVTIEDLPGSGEDGVKRLELPKLDLPAPVSITVRGARYGSEDGSTTPIPGAAVIFESSSVGRGVVNLQLLTNELGEIESSDGSPGAELYPGTYRVDVLPPAGNSAQGERFEPTSLTKLEVGRGGGSVEHVVVLPQRDLVRATVTANGRPVPRARYFVEPENSSIQDSALIGATDEQGAFWLPSSLESCAIAIRSPRESRYPWLVQTGFVVENATNFIFELENPFVWESRISGPGGAPISGAHIDWYTLYDGRPYLVARSETDSDGRTVALLPP